MRSRIKVALLAVAAAALIPWGTGQASAAPDQGNALGKKSQWTAPGDEVRDLLIQTIGDDLPQFPYCRRPLERLDLMINSSDFVWPNSLTILGETQTIDINNMNLLAGPFVDPSRQLWWSSGMWLAWRAAVFAENGQPELAATAARALLTEVQKTPDPGAATPEALEVAKSVGWGFGNVYRRSQALLCLRAVLPAAELDPIIRMHANTFLEPLRYPGPPNKDVNNLGMLVNLHLLDVADAIGDPNYATAAVSRMSTEFPQVFSETGFSYEASSHYHGVNYLGWTDAMFVLQNRGYAAEAAALANILTGALNASAHFISPTGDPMLYGNTRASDALLRPEVDATRPLTLIDSKAGTAFGRYSWTKRGTTVWSTVNRPKRGAHGHWDGLSATWQTGGLPVLVDPGQPRYDRSPLTLWSRSTSGHNTVTASGQEKLRYQDGYLKHANARGVDVVTMMRQTRDTKVQRQVLVDDRRKTFEVSDSSNRRLTQNWHLSPDWQAGRVKGNQLQLSHPSGQKLFVTVSKRAKISVLRGSESPIGGWYAADFDTPVAATQVVIAGGKTLDTQFALGDPLTSAGLRMAKQSEEKNRKLSFQWSPVQVKAKKAKKAKKAAKQAKVIGHRIQMQEKNGLWKTVEISGSARKFAATQTKLKNGVSYRFRGATLSKKGQSAYAKPTKWAVPHTTPNVVAVDKAQLLGKVGKKKVQKVQIGLLYPEIDGGAKVTSYESRVGAGDWRRSKRKSVKVEMKGKKEVLYVKAVNRAGAGKTFKVKIKLNKTGDLIVNGVNFTPPTEPAPAVPDSPAPAPAPAVP